MTLPEVFELYEYWDSAPPVNEVLAMLASVYTTWKPNQKPQTAADHQASLEARWRAGAMNVKQMFEATGGRIRAGDGAHPLAQAIDTGIGPFPGLH